MKNSTFLGTHDILGYKTPRAEQKTPSCHMGGSGLALRLPGIYERDQKQAPLTANER